jgi:hypothetical protein
MALGKRKDEQQVNIRTYIPEPKRRGKRNWQNVPEEKRQAVLNNRRRTRRPKSKRLQRLRSERVERSFAHLCDSDFVSTVGVDEGMVRQYIRNQEKNEITNMFLGIIAKLLNRSTSQRSKFRWYQYRLRSLLVLMLMVAIASSWFAANSPDFDTSSRFDGQVPEPSTITLILTTILGGLLWWRRRR